jgi:hypothetical protein
MNNSQLKISFAESIELIRKLLPFASTLDFNLRKNTIEYKDHNNRIFFRFRFPYFFNFNQFPLNKSLDDYQREIPDIFILLIQAGNAALGVYSEGKFCEHKVIRKYMVRKKQGKAQINYLKTKGKSRLGSRIRLAKSVEFFEEINERISQWSKVYFPETILYSCTPTLWGMLFRSKIKASFLKDDMRLKKIPLDIDIPDYREMNNVIKYVRNGYLEISGDCPAEFLKILINNGQE